MLEDARRRLGKAAASTASSHWHQLLAPITKGRRRARAKRQMAAPRNHPSPQSTFKLLCQTRHISRRGDHGKRPKSGPEWRLHEKPPDTTKPGSNGGPKPAPRPDTTRPGRSTASSATSELALVFLPPPRALPVGTSPPFLPSPPCKWRRTPRHRRRFGATEGAHIGTVVEAACGRSHCADVGSDHSGDMAFMPS